MIPGLDSSVYNASNGHGCTPVLSFFTGGGFLDIGFSLSSGFRVVWTNENKDIFANMYEHGMSSLAGAFPACHFLPKISDRRSIEDISPENAMSAAFPDGAPDFFGVIGGPPCPDFANGGKYRGHSGHLGRLSQIYVDRICALKPGFFIFENVAGLLSKRNAGFLKILQEQMERAGYNVDLRLLNSLDLGLAQDRERVIILGIQKEITAACAGHNVPESEREWFTWPRIDKYHSAKKRFIWPAIAESGETLVLPEDVPYELTVASLLDGKEAPGVLPNGDEHFKPYSGKFQTVREGDTTRKSFKRLHRYRYSPTACYGHNEVHVHPWEDRRLTLREAMRIQGVPDDYVLPATMPLGAKYLMVANGVPVALAYHVAKRLKEFLQPFTDRLSTRG